jgi:serine/threonine protein kinase
VLKEIRGRPHEHIVTHLATFTDADTFYILFPIARCDLWTFCGRTTAPPLKRDFVLWFFAQVKGLADAVLHLHLLGDSILAQTCTTNDVSAHVRSTIHGDIKPENILVFEAANGNSLGIFKLSDFGSSRVLEDTKKARPQRDRLFRGTPAYEAPDLLTSNELSCEMDMWSLGCVFLELLNWIFFPQGSEITGFMTQRATETLSGSATYWQLSEGGKVNIKWAVGRRLVDLENKHILGRRAFERLLHGIWFLINSLPNGRYSAATLVGDLESTIQRLELDLAKDPDCYLYHTLDPDPATLRRNYTTGFQRKLASIYGVTERTSATHPDIAPASPDPATLSSNYTTNFQRKISRY